ncbi:hypothetical protein J6590_041386 [Homalodisca vitripennis]|nr:hypothetical protein J6590_041386 [Homalodisca vitripennis]
MDRSSRPAVKTSRRGQECVGFLKHINLADQDRHKRAPLCQRRQCDVSLKMWKNIRLFILKRGVLRWRVSRVGREGGAGNTDTDVFPLTAEHVWQECSQHRHIYRQALEQFDDSNYNIMDHDFFKTAQKEVLECTEPLNHGDSGLRYADARPLNCGSNVKSQSSTPFKGEAV